MGSASCGKVHRKHPRFCAQVQPLRLFAFSLLLPAHTPAPFPAPLLTPLTRCLVLHASGLSPRFQVSLLEPLGRKHCPLASHVAPSCHDMCYSIYLMYITGSNLWQFKMISSTLSWGSSRLWGSSRCYPSHCCGADHNVIHHVIVDDVIQEEVGHWAGSLVILWGH